MVGVRKLVFTGALLVVLPFAAVAQEKDMPKGNGPKAMPPAVTADKGDKGEEGGKPGDPAVGPGGACPAPCAPATTKVCKLVPTQCQETRTVMKPVQKTECYTAYRTEYVTEKKCVPVTTYKHVTETVMETRTKCIKVPVVEEKVVMEKRKHIEWVTEYKEKCKICFQKECKTIGCNKSCGGCGDGCCDKGFSCSIPVYKPYLDKQCVPCTKPVCRTECVPVTKKCCSYRTEVKTECVPVCKTKCIPCTETREVCCTKAVCVPYQATRCVTVMQPCTEVVTVCKMVPTWVEVPCPTPACPPACPPANACPPASPCGPVAGAPCGDPCGTGCGNGCGSCCCGEKLKECCCKLKECCYKVKGCCEKLKGCFCCGCCCK